MKISNISHLLYKYKKNYHVSDIPNRIYRTMQDVFVYNPSEIKEVNEITGVKLGKFGTQCDGSYPLRRFFNQFKTQKQKKELNNLLQNGYSTNICGDAYCFLKDNADIPLSTSGIYSCSVIYLFNKNNNKHFLYHVYHEFEPDKMKHIINTFMPEKYTKACLVPGRNTFIYGYLTELFDTVKSIVPEVPVTVRHFTTPYPEVVGFRGDVFEIPNRKFMKDLKDGKTCYTGEGQATFKIRDLKSYVIFTEITNCKNADDINSLRHVYRSKLKYKSIFPILNKLLNEREKSLRLK